MLNHLGYQVERRNSQRSSHDQQKIDFSKMLLFNWFDELLWQCLSEHHNCWLHRTPTTILIAKHYFLRLNRLLQRCHIMIFFALSAVGSSICSVCLNNEWHVHSCFLLQVVDVLSQVLHQNAFILQQLYEEVSWSRVVVCRIEFLMLRELVKGPRIV